MLPNSRKEGRSFFSRESFFHSLGDKCQTAAPSGPSTHPPVGSPRQLRIWPTQEVASSLNRLPFLRPQLSLRRGIPGCRALGLLHGSPLRHAPRACHGLRQELFPRLSAGVAKTRRTRLRAAARKEGGGNEFLLVGSIEANRRACAQRLTTEARAFARL
jgi:hypothetical protein